MLTTFRQRFSTIRWKLTGSYVLVSLFLEATMLCIFIGIVLWLLHTPYIPHHFAKETLELANVLQPGFGDPPYTPEILGNQLLILSNSQNLPTQTQPSPTNPPASQLSSVTLSSNDTAFFLAVLDTSGRIITTTLPLNLNYPTGALLSALEPNPSDILIARALHGITDTTQLGAWSVSDHSPLSAAPILSDSGEVLGVVYTRLLNFPDPNSIWNSIPPFLLATIVPYLVISGGIGLLYSWPIGQGFSRRLKHLTQATAALAAGDLSQRVQDSSADEIGQLARQFNTMAEQLAENMRTLRLLADKNAQLAEQAAQLATIEERNRLARDLHDSVSQELFSMTMLSAAARRLIENNPTAAAAQLGEIQATAQRALQETRGLIFALRPAMLNGRGLGPALRDLVGAIQERQGIVVDLRISGERQLPLEYEQAIFRIAQEALANVARHSGAREVHIILEYGQDQIILRVDDHGKGFDPTTPCNARSIGLQSMRERAGALGGMLRIESAPGHGTNLMITIPIANR